MSQTCSRSADRPAHLGCSAKRSKSHLRRGWPAMNQASRAALHHPLFLLSDELQEVLLGQEGVFLGEGVTGVGHFFDDSVARDEVIFREAEIAGPVVVPEINDGDASLLRERRLDAGEVVSAMLEIVLGVAESGVVHYLGRWQM